MIGDVDIPRARIVNAARAFTKSKDLRDAMKRAGVTDKPDIYFLDEVEHAPA